MVANMGPIDRSIRMAGGLALLSLVFLAHGYLRWLGLIGVLPLASGLLAWCPIYAWLTQD